MLEASFAAANVSLERVKRTHSGDNRLRKAEGGLVSCANNWTSPNFPSFEKAAGKHCNRDRFL